jgi:hypothetical protein
METDGLEAQCPYCGETVTLTVEPHGPPREEYVEDCSVCCRPWDVVVTREEEGVTVDLRRGDD